MANVGAKSHKVTDVSAAHGGVEQPQGVSLALGLPGRDQQYLCPKIDH